MEVYPFEGIIKAAYRFFSAAYPDLKKKGDITIEKIRKAYGNRKNFGNAEKNQFTGDLEENHFMRIEYFQVFPPYSQSVLIDRGPNAPNGVLITVDAYFKGQEITDNKGNPITDKNGKLVRARDETELIEPTKVGKVRAFTKPSINSTLSSNKNALRASPHFPKALARRLTH